MSDSNNLRQRRTDPSSGTSPTNSDANAAPDPETRGKGGGNLGQFSGGYVDHSLNTYTTALALIIPLAVIYFSFWPLIKEELAKGEPLFGIAPEVKEDLGRLWRVFKGKIGLGGNGMR